MKIAMKNNLLLSPILLSFIIFSPSASAIQKCQDADGKWHYGDIAVAECENSKVTTLNDQGFITDELAAPKTDEEIRAEQELIAAELAEQERLKKEQEEHVRILSIYETEDDIDRQRDNQVSSVQSNIDVHQSYLRNMEIRIADFEKDKSAATRDWQKEELQAEIDQAHIRVEKSKKELAALIEQKSGILERFDKEKELYLKLVSESK